jgi:HAMP domain-containing protein
LSREEVGNCTPSQFLRHLRNLAKTDFSEDILWTLWADRLPPQVQAIIATQSTTPLNDVALVADKVNAITIPRVAAVSSARQVERLQSLTRDFKVDMLTKQVEELTTQVSALTSTTRIVNHTQRRDRSFSRDHHGNFSHRPSQQPSLISSNPEWCCYHQNFGEQAKEMYAPM